MPRVEGVPSLLLFVWHFSLTGRPARFGPCFDPMTFQSKSADTVSCVPIMRVRDFFRGIVSHHHDAFNRSTFLHLRAELSLGKKSATALASNLVIQGYVEAQNSNLEYVITEKGRALIRSSAPGKVNRSTAEEALANLLKRVGQYNLDAGKMFIIETPGCLWSFLGTGDKLDDLDVAMKKRDRNLNDPDRAQTSLAYARRSGRRFNSFIEELF
jgi:hypothetical protein